MKDKKELIEEFLNEWGILKDEEGTYDLRDELKGDVIALIEGLMPTKDDITNAYIDFQWGLSASEDYHEALEYGFGKGIEWLRSRILEQLK